MQGKTTIELTIDEDLEDYLKDTIRFILFARRSDLGGPFDFETDEALQMAVIIAIQTASRLADVVSHNTSECENLIKDFLGYDPFFNDDGEDVEPEELARKLGLSIRRRPKRPKAKTKRKSRVRGGAATLALLVGLVVFSIPPAIADWVPSCEEALGTAQELVIDQANSYRNMIADAGGGMLLSQIRIGLADPEQISVDGATSQRTCSATMTTINVTKNTAEDSEITYVVSQLAGGSPGEYHVALD